MGFHTDIAALEKARLSAEDAIQQAKHDDKEYHNRLEGLSSNPQVALIELFFLMAASSTNDTALGHFMNKLGVTSDGLVVLSKAGAVNNDVTTMTQDSNSHLSTIAESYSQLNTTLSKFQNSDPEQQIIDPETLNVLMNTTQSNRNLFFIEGAPDNPASGWLFSNAPGTSKISSIAEWKQDLEEQGNVQDSTTALKDLTNHSQTFTETTQTANAVLNNNAKQDTSMIQAIEQFDASVAQMINAVKKAAIQHTSQGT